MRIIIHHCFCIRLIHYLSPINSCLFDQILSMGEDILYIVDIRINTFKHLGHVSIVRRYVKNWKKVAWSLRNVERETNKDNIITLVLQDGFEYEMRYSLVWPFINLLHSYKLLGLKIDQTDAITWLNIANGSYNKLISQFNYSEVFEKCKSGATIGPQYGSLFALVRKYCPKIIVETGVAQGLSSWFILSALELNDDGFLISIDLPNRDPQGTINSDGQLDSVYTPIDKRPGWLVPDYLRERWDLRIGKATSLLPSIDCGIDMFFHDSEHTYKNMTFELEWAHSHINKSGIIMSDDIGWNKAWPDFIGRHPDLTLMNLPSIGSVSI